MRNLFINRPDDWHVHFRDQEKLAFTVPDTAKHFARALVMPNLKPALTSIKDLVAYRERIRAASSLYPTFTPYMTFYLNQTIDPAELVIAKQHDYILGAKYYPAGATTNSEEGVQSLKTLYPLLDIMQEKELVLQIHGEVTHSDIFERESLFIETCLIPLIANFPKLRIVLEHISTCAAVDFVAAASDNLAATITPHHLRYNRNALLAGGIKPHYYCLPILKHERDQKALIQAATSGNPCFFAGTDSAPHAQAHKESACGCAGIYSAPFAVPIYAEIFAAQGKLDRLNAFMSCFGASFYQLPQLKEKIELVEQTQVIPQTLSFGYETVVPIGAGEQLCWSVKE